MHSILLRTHIFNTPALILPVVKLSSLWNHHYNRHDHLFLALFASQTFTALSTTFGVAIRFLLALVEAFVGFDQERTSHEPFLILVVSYSNSVLWQGR
jgi:hypothetical protein